MSCSISSMARSALSARRKPIMRCDSSAPMPAIGSSSSSSLGSPASAMAISSWRCSPWLRAAASVSARAPRPTASRPRRAGAAQALVAARIGQEAERMAGMRLDRQRHVLERGELAQHRGDLEGARQAQPDAGMGRQVRDVAAGEVDGAGIGRQVAGELAHQRGLAGAVGADQGMDLARPDIDRDGVGGDQAAEALDQAESVRRSGSATAAPQQ